MEFVILSPQTSSRDNINLFDEPNLFYYKKYLVGYLPAPDLSCGMQDLCLQHVGSSFPDQGLNPGLPTGSSES